MINNNNNNLYERNYTKRYKQRYHLSLLHNIKSLKQNVIKFDTKTTKRKMDEPLKQQQ